MQAQELRIIQIKRDSALVEEAFLLAEAERDRQLVDYEARPSLAGAAELGHLWAAIGEGPGEGRLLGYALTFITRGELLLSQILVAPAERGQGIGTRLIEAVCGWAGERDLTVTALLPEGKIAGCWIRWGFAARRGAGADGLVTYTGRRFQRLERESAPDLFGGALPAGTAPAPLSQLAPLPAMLDPDLFEALAQCPALEAETELRVLASSRFRREFEAALGTETAEEMARGHSRDPRGRTAAAREKRIHALAHFRRIGPGALDLEPYRARASRVLAESEDKERPADLPLEELAIAAALGLPVFLTLNENLRRREDAVYRELGVRPATPTEALLGLQILRREREYAPIRLHAENLRPGLIAEDQVPRLAERFLAEEFGETPHTLFHKLERFGIGATARRLLIGTQGQPGAEGVPPLAESLQALVVVLRNHREILRVPLLRIPEHPLRPTFARQILAGLIDDALTEGRRLLLVQDGYLHPEVTEALRECGFLPASADCYVRVLLPGARRPKAWTADLLQVAELDPVAGPALAQLLGHLAPKAAGIPKEDFLELERLLAPGRVLGAELPAYLVQMKPGWAMRVFDAELAEYDLFEGTRRASLRPREGVFFLPPGTAAQAQPGRILWQVGSRTGAGLLRAVSNLVAVEVGPVAELYRKYRRLGYFTDKDVQSMGAAGRKGGGEGELFAAEVCAWQFADTWLLPRPLAWPETASILEETENRTQFGALTTLSQEGFFQLLHTASTPAPEKENNDLGLLWD
jgi:GNAT superfamily N-acetyltransferase